MQEGESNSKGLVMTGQTMDKSLDWIQMHLKSAPLYFLGKVLLQETTNGYCRFSRHFPRKDAGANGILRVCESIP